MVAAHQWVSTTAGRIATCPYSWMQAVHWVGGSGLYVPSRSHGPKWGPTTVLIAQELSALTECRPGIDYLARKLQLSERTVQYHLDMLREAGLLVYRSKGTRVSGSIRHASVYERVIPVQFDTALGIRTIGDGIERRPVGIAEEGRSLIGKLAKKARRKVRRKRANRAVDNRKRCTPMQGGTSASTTTSLTRSPSEKNLASGEADCPTPKKPKRGPRKLNKVGRRYQLARQLITQVPWLRGASVRRIAWITRHVSDAGWTALEVQAIADEGGPLTAADVRRCSGMLAHRLKGVHLLYTTTAQRQRLVADWQDSRAAERARHDGYDEGITGAPERMSVRRLMTEATRRMRAAATPADGIEVSADDRLDIESLSHAERLDLRAAAEKNLALIHDFIDNHGERDARRLYTNRLVDRALKRFTGLIRINTWQEATYA